MRRLSKIPGLVSILSLALLAGALPPAASLQESAGEAEESPGAPYRVFPADRPSQDARLHSPAVTTDTQVQWTPPSDPIDWLQRSKDLSKRVRLAAGLWPYPGAVLESHVHAVHDRDAYTVENLLFQGHFFDFVPSNLYRPKGGAEQKAIVLCPHGHREGGRLMERSDEEARALVESGEERSLEAAKYPLQAYCTQLARMGCIVLMYDMAGFGDYKDYDHEGDFTSVEEALRVQNVYGLQLWNSTMALNYLWNLDGTDRKRVGIAGAGAGASQALFLAAADTDERIKAVFAAGFVSCSYQGGCRCENPPHLRVGTSNVELAAMIAPRALALTGARDWTLDAEAEVLSALRRHWRVMGDEKHLTLKFGPEYGDDFNARTRELMYDFFNDRLNLGLEGPIVEAPFEPLTPDELRVFDAQHRAPPPHARDAAGVYEVFTGNCDAQIELLFHEETPHRVKVFRGVEFEALRLLLATELPAPEEVDSEVLGTERLEGRSVRRLKLARTGSGEEVPAVLVMPDEWNGTLVVGVSDEGKAGFLGQGRSSLAGAAGVVEKGAAFLSPDVMLTGEFQNAAGDSAPRLPVDAERHARDVSYTYGYNRTLLAERVHDILTTIGYALSIEGVQRLNLVGTGDAGPWVLMARGLAGDVERAGDAIERTAAQWSWTFDHVASFEDPNFLPGALRYGGMRAFSALTAPAELCLVGFPSQKVRPEIPEMALKAYRSLDALEHVRSVGSERYAAVIDWLAEPAP